MNRWKRRPIRAFLLLLSLALLLAIPIYAHSGGTDGNGGHYGPGGYHYHHGYPAHQHTGGVCPYDFDDQTGKNSGPSTGNSSSQSPKASSTSHSTSDWHLTLTNFLNALFSIAFLLFWWVPFSIISWLFKKLCALFSKVHSFLRNSTSPTIQNGGANMAENESTLSLTVSYATFISNELKAYIPTRHQSNAFYITIGALTAWAEMVLSQTRQLSNHIIENASISSDPHSANTAGNLMRHSADTIGAALSADSPKNCFSVFASTLMTLLQIESNIEVHIQISTLLSSYTRAYADAHPKTTLSDSGKEETSSMENPKIEKTVSKRSLRYWRKNCVIAILAVLCICLLIWGLFLNSSLSAAQIEISSLKEENSILVEEVSTRKTQNAAFAREVGALRAQLELQKRLYK